MPLQVSLAVVAFLVARHMGGLKGVQRKVLVMAEWLVRSLPCCSIREAQTASQVPPACLLPALSAKPLVMEL